jgi:hypothetical protein
MKCPKHPDPAHDVCPSCYIELVESLRAENAALKERNAELEEMGRAWQESDEHKHASILREKIDRVLAENAALREVVEAATKWADVKKKPFSMVDIMLLRSIRDFKEKS